MLRSLTLFLLSLALATVLPASLRAEDPPVETQFQKDIKSGKLSAEQALRVLADRIPALRGDCEMGAVDEWYADFHYYVWNVPRPPKGERFDPGRPRSVLIQMSAACNPPSIADRVVYAVAECKFDEARAHLDRLVEVTGLYRRQLTRARRVGRYAARDIELLEDRVDSAEIELRRAQSAYSKAREECDKKPKEEQQQQEQQVEEAEVGACPGRPAGDCGRWAPLLGRWTSRKHGGAIETSLAADGTLTARIVATNKVMERNGFTSGMTVLRGWVPKGGSLTWLVSANDGEYFIAAQPDRRPGEMYGDPKWTKSGVIMIETKDPGRLQIPAPLESRLSDYDPWVRTGNGP